MIAPLSRPRHFRLALLILFALAFASPARAATADSSATLAATTAAPWNPTGIVGASDPWEAVVRFPGRIVSLPLAGLGQGVRLGLLAAERNFVAQKISYQLHKVPLPVTLGPAGLGDHTGLGGRAAYDFGTYPWETLGAFEASTRGYTRVRARVRAGVLELSGYDERRPADQYFGTGMDSRREDRSRYGMIERGVSLGMNLQSDVRHGRTPRAAMSVWAGPRWSRLTQGYQEDEASIAERFPSAYAGLIDREFEHFRYGARIAIDQRDGSPHWTRGWQASGSLERFGDPLVESPTRTGARFTRFDGKAQAGFSFWRDPRTIRLALTVVDVSVGANRDRFLPGDEARLGGHTGLTGFESHRFHDLDAINLRASYIFPIAHFVEMDVHGDTGGVFASLSDDARWNRLRQSAGFAVRARTASSIIGSVGMDFSSEKARLVFSIGTDS